MIFFVYLLIFLVTRWVLWEIQQAFSDVEEKAPKNRPAAFAAYQPQPRVRVLPFLEPRRRVG